MRRLIPVVLLILLAVSPSSDPFASSDQSHTPNLSPGARDLTLDEARVALDFIFQARTDAALAYLDSMSATCDGHPFYLLIRGRTLQEYIPMDDANNDYAKLASEPALAAFDRCIEVCTQRMDAGNKDAVLNLYRGWAWMHKSYIRSLSRDMWTAGKEAKKGKEDLQLYLAAYPDDPTANGLMGSFLYFADIIPSIFKFISKLLGMPTGDRKRGLDHLQYAVQQGGGVLETDWRFTLYYVYFYFEGRYEDALSGLGKMAERYPAYTRTMLPFAVSRAYSPRLASNHEAQIDTVLDRFQDNSSDAIDRNNVYLVEGYQAYSDRFYRPSRAIERFDKIIRERPAHPDWMDGFARLQMAQIHASHGRKTDALVLLQSVSGFYKDPAENLIKDIDKFAKAFERPPTYPPESWIEALYRADNDSLHVLEERFARLADESLPALFYLADCQLLRGDLSGAEKTYRRVVGEKAPGWEAPFQMIAGSRLAEISAARGKYGKAASYIDTALEFYTKEYLVDWVLEGRKRYFERLDHGEEKGPPTLLSNHL